MKVTIEIYTDKMMPLTEALDYMTNEWVAGGNSCEETVLDLRDALRLLVPLIPELREKRQ
jgi:hypothetical protein